MALKASPIGSHPLAGKHIIVAGAGIAGLSFTRALDRNWPHGALPPRITLYERCEEIVPPEREGYSLSIRSDRSSGGMQALQKLGLLDSLLKKSLAGLNEGRGSFNLWDCEWRPILQAKLPETPSDGLPVSHMRVARNVLRCHLVEGLPDSAKIHWSLACQSAEMLQDKRVKVLLSDGTTDECDLLIAADGAHSRVRAELRPHDQLTYAGAVLITGNSKFHEGVPDLIKENWGLALGGGGTGLFVSPIDRSSAVWGVSYRSSEPRESIRGNSAVEKKDQILNEARTRGKAFAEPFRQLINATDPKTLMVFSAMDKQPFAHSEFSETNVVFIGDSNHAMSPFAGNGANMALMDGVLLATELCNSTDVASAVTAYDARSMPRSQTAIQQSHWSISLAHSTGWWLTWWKFVLHLVNLFLFR